VLLTDLPRISTYKQITPDLLWSKYSVIQHIVFWILAIIGWHGLHWLGGHFDRFTLPIWLYLAKFRTFVYTGDFSGEIWLGLIAGVVVLGVIILVDYMTARIKGKPLVEQILRNHHLLPRTSRQQLIAAGVGINAAIFEELVFRGAVFLLLWVLSDSILLSILITSLLFAVLHTPIQGWYSTVLIFGVGILLNILLLVTEAFYAPIFCHIVVNVGNLFIIPSFFEDELEELSLQDSGLSTGDIPDRSTD